MIRGGRRTRLKEPTLVCEGTVTLQNANDTQNKSVRLIKLLILKVADFVILNTFLQIYNV